MSCTFRHRGVQLILAYSWARAVILEAGKGRGGMFLFCFFTFIPVPLSSLSLSFISYTVSSIPFSGRPHKKTKVNVSLDPNAIKKTYYVLRLICIEGHWISTILYKGENFCDFLFCSSSHIAPSEKVPDIVEKNVFPQ